MDGLWSGWRFAIIFMKKLQNILGVAYALSSIGNVSVLLTIKNFQLVLLFQMPYSTI